MSEMELMSIILQFQQRMKYKTYLEDTNGREGKRGMGIEERKQEIRFIKIEVITGEVEKKGGCRSENY